MTVKEIDLRGRSLPETGNALLKAYDTVAEGERVTALLDDLGPALRMWLIEAGARYAIAEADGGALRLVLTRARAPALTAAPGLHHIVAHRNGNLWCAGRDARVARIDGDSGEVAEIARVARKASHLAVDPSGKWLYLADFAGAELIVMAADSLEVIARLPAPGGPQLPLSPAAGVVCVTGPGSGTVTIARKGKRGFSHRIVAVGAVPHHCAATTDGRHLLVACAGDGEVVKLDLDSGAVEGRIKTGAGAAHIVAHPDGARFYCANSFDGTLTAFSEDGEVFGTAPCGGWAHHPEVSHDGAHVYVVNFLDDRVSVLNAATLARVGDLETEPYAHEIAISPNGQTLVLPGYGSDHIRLYDAVTLELKSRLKVGAGSPHTAFSRDGRWAYVTCSVDDHIARVDMMTGVVAGRLRLH